MYCVNDGAVMDAWATDQGVDQTHGLLKMMGDPSGALTRALGMTLNHPGPMSKLGYERCKRFAMYVVDGVIKVLKDDLRAKKKHLEAWQAYTSEKLAFEVTEFEGNHLFFYQYPERAKWMENIVKGLPSGFGSVELS